MVSMMRGIYAVTPSIVHRRKLSEMPTGFLGSEREDGGDDES